MAAATTEVGPAGLQADTVPGGSETILVVEDDAEVRATIVSHLGRLGYAVVEAPHGSAALNLLRDGRHIDLLFTDIVMPGGLNGTELAEKARELRPGLKVLFTTGYAEAAVGRGPLAPNTDWILSKPFRRNELAARVRELLDS